MTLNAPVLFFTLATLSATSLAQTPVSVVEYYNKASATYFLSGRAGEQIMLDTHTDFQRTGESFSAVSAIGASAPLESVCRYRIAIDGTAFSSHFYGIGSDCGLVSALSPPNFTNEGFDFAVDPPYAGLCPSGAMVPVYRSRRNLTPVDVPNHRYSVGAAAYQDMLKRGWTGEGVVFCVRSVTTETPLPTFADSPAFEARCAAPRVGTSRYTGQPYRDVQGTLADEKNWLRSFTDETYLWYREVPLLNPANYSTTASWFAALKTPALALSGAPKDRFHFTQATDDREASDAGVSYGYGVTWSAIASSPPRRWLAAVVIEGSPAAAAGVKRGDSIVSIDGVLFRTGGDVTTLNNGLFPPTIGENHRFVLAPVDGSAQKTTALRSAAVAIRPVPVSGVVNTPSGRVGYIAFTTFNTFSSEKAIADAVAGLVASGGVTDLVLDLRYNGGGYVFISAETAFMIAGAARTANKTFELLKANDKNPFNTEDRFAFYNVGSGFSGGITSGQPLPSLNLGRVFVLTSARTCSASEAVINGLRGIDVEVILIGGQTCGKPYAFRSTDNCGVTYSTIQLTGINNKGEGDYIDGFAPTCDAADDMTKALGDPGEAQLAAALSYRATQVCAAAPTANAGQRIGESPATKANTGGALSVREFARVTDNEKLIEPSGQFRSSQLRVVPVAPLDLGAVDINGMANTSAR